jgi:hypothetical protein
MLPGPPPHATSPPSSSNTKVCAHATHHPSSHGVVAVRGQDDDRDIDAVDSHVSLQLYWWSGLGFVCCSDLASSSASVLGGCWCCSAAGPRPIAAGSVPICSAMLLAPPPCCLRWYRTVARSEARRQFRSNHAAG